jgi:hypothetical protein
LKPRQAFIIYSTFYQDSISTFAHKASPAPFLIQSEIVMLCEKTMHRRKWIVIDAPGAILVVTMRHLLNYRVSNNNHTATWNKWAKGSQLL